MPDASQEAISRDRYRLGNPYAHSDGNGGFSALAAEPAQPEASDLRITQSRRKLEDPYAYMDGDGQFSALAPGASSRCRPAPIDAKTIRNGAKTGRRFSYEEIETFARTMQAILWKDRDAYWSGNAPDDPLDVLDPEIAFRALDYDVSTPTAVGQYHGTSGATDVAGIIDQPNKAVELAQNYPPTTRRFTAAHELGHAILHQHAGLHRDQPIDGGSAPVAGKHNRTEQEANKFATFFLMPAKLVKAEFENRYLSEPFIINDDTAFALIQDNADALRRQCDSRKTLARTLASNHRYNGRDFPSLAERFGVSVGAMGIRLEELDLLQ